MYDVADLYKAETSILAAFEVVAEASPEENIGQKTRLRMRDAFIDGKVIKSIIRDVKYLLDISAELDQWGEADVIHLWDERGDLVKYGVNYREFE